MSSGRCAQGRYLDSRRRACEFVTHGPPPALLLTNPIGDSGPRFYVSESLRAYCSREPLSARSQQSETCISCALMRVLSSEGAWLEWKDQVRDRGTAKLGQDTWTVPRGCWTLHLLFLVPGVIQNSHSLDMMSQTDL